MSISAGNDHLLALTSSGRTFVHPINLNANSHGQMGSRKFDVPDHSSVTHPHARKTFELTPKSIADPYVKSTPAIRGKTSTSQSASNEVTLLDDSSIHFSDRLFEIPALKGVQVDKIATGSRSSFVKTSQGRVLGWGANDFGYVQVYSGSQISTLIRVQADWVGRKHHVGCHHRSDRGCPMEKHAPGHEDNVS